MKKQLYYIAITITLVLLVMELTYINAKSLIFLVAELGLVDRIFAVVGALAFSMVTVLVMRTTSNRLMRIIFPLFDALLVFGGFNLKFANNLLDNPIAFYLTIFFALFTFTIMYGLGKISYERDVNNDIELKRINNELEQKLAELSGVNEKLNHELEELKRVHAESRRNAEEFLRNHILYESWVSKKRSEQKRNGHDAKIVELADLIKSGRTITLEEYLSYKHS